MKPFPDDIAEMRARGYDSETIAAAEQHSKRWAAAMDACRNIEATYGIGTDTRNAKNHSSKPAPERESYRGMTINERLLAAGLHQYFDAAACNRDGSAMIALLMAIELDELQAKSTTDAILNRPEEYGY